VVQYLLLLAATTIRPAPTYAIISSRPRERRTPDKSGTEIVWPAS